MKIIEFLNEAYQTSTNKKEEVEYGLHFLTYQDEGNPKLKTKEIHGFLNPRETPLTGEEKLEKGVYLLWSSTIRNAEILMKYSTMEEAKEQEKRIKETFFDERDALFIKEVKTEEK